MHNAVQHLPLLPAPQASQLFERAVTGVMKKCSLLYFPYADFEEQNMKFEKVPRPLDILMLLLTILMY